VVAACAFLEGCGGRELAAAGGEGAACFDLRVREGEGRRAISWRGCAQHVALHCWVGVSRASAASAGSPQQAFPPHDARGGAAGRGYSFFFYAALGGLSSHAPSPPPYDKMGRLSITGGGWGPRVCGAHTGLRSNKLAEPANGKMNKMKGLDHCFSPSNSRVCVCLPRSAQPQHTAPHVSSMPPRPARLAIGLGVEAAGAAPPARPLDPAPGDEALEDDAGLAPPARASSPPGPSGRRIDRGGHFQHGSVSRWTQRERERERDRERERERERGESNASPPAARSIRERWTRSFLFSRSRTHPLSSTHRSPSPSWMTGVSSCRAGGGLRW